MKSPLSRDPAGVAEQAGEQADALAVRLEQGTRALATFVSGLSTAEWNTRVPHDGRTIGVVVHHVANVLPLEIQLAQTVASGTAVTGVTWDVIHKMNADHAKAVADVTRESALALLSQ